MAGLDASRQGILGNLSFQANLNSNSAIVSAGLIGDAAGVTGLSLGKVQGIVAAEGSINLLNGKTSSAAFYGQNLRGSANGAPIEAIFTQHGLRLSFNLTGMDLGGLSFILADLNALTVDKNGNLAGPVA